MTKNNKELLSNIIKITIGAFIFSASVQVMAIPNNLGEGGVTGITMILKYLYDIPTAYTNMFFNAILLVIGYKFLDKKTIFYTLYAIAIISVFLHLLEPYPFQTSEVIIGAIGAGVLMGIGIGLIMRGNGTTAGSGILAKLANKYLGWNTSYAMLFFDLIVVIPSAFVIGIESMMFTFVSLAVSTKLLDFILEGSNPKKSITIISEKHEAVAKEISDQLGRGLTVVDGVGYYQKNPKTILYVVISRQQLLPIQKIINEIDPLAFVIINDVQSVIGEGFTREFFDEEEELNPNEM
ncbi:YitT family protein [Vagococcus coleopterorum]|uniref:YitT family protein n=1 Tax=Vagococcus coleopterorum TaxID=2714946 RepID=A0A6G8AMV7_9ENTE|nr:YitT family protein [Vagococcus coleopterorum]QIL46282.1 YitT family protein [Vagococcus coleopterorum]